MNLIEEIKKKDENYELIFVGDFIDRGENSYQIIQFILNNINIKNKIYAVKGNHEKMAFNYFFSSINDKIWLRNGGDVVISSYMKHLNKETNITYESNIDLREQALEELKKDIKELNKLPYYLIFNNEKINENRKLLITHAPSLEFIDEYIENDYKNTLNDDLILWNRKLPSFKNKNFKNDKYFNISGHNITQNLINANIYNFADSDKIINSIKMEKSTSTSKQSEGGR
jgi:serine/threonine protein phosphatase 1